MSHSRSTMEKPFFERIDNLEDGHAREILKAIIHGNIGRLVGISEAIHMAGGSRIYVEQLIKTGAIAEMPRKSQSYNSKRRISICDCILNSSITHL